VSFSSLLFNILFEFLAREIRQEKEIRRIKIGVVKLSLCVDDIILYVKDPKAFTRKLLGLINTWKNSRIQNQHTKISSFLYTNNKQAEKEIRKTTIFIIASKINK
jgi:hypothetical protein